MAHHPAKEPIGRPVLNSNTDVNRVCCNSLTETLQPRVKTSSLTALGTHAASYPDTPPPSRGSANSENSLTAPPSQPTRVNETGGPCLPSQNTAWHGDLIAVPCIDNGAHNGSVPPGGTEPHIPVTCIDSTGSNTSVHHGRREHAPHGTLVPGSASNFNSGAHSGSIPSIGHAPHCNGVPDRDINSSTLHEPGRVRCSCIDHSNSNWHAYSNTAIGAEDVELGVDLSSPSGPTLNSCGVPPRSSISHSHDSNRGGECSDTHHCPCPHDVENQHSGGHSDSSLTYSCQRNSLNARPLPDCRRLSHGNSECSLNGTVCSCGGNFSRCSERQVGEPPGDGLPGFCPRRNNALRDDRSVNDALPLLKARSDTGAGATPGSHQVLPRAFSWDLCRRMAEGIVQGARVPVGKEPLLTKENDPTTDSWSGSSLSDGPICRICHEGSSEGRLVRPCRCCGTLSYTHSWCLEKWLQTKNEDICELCRYQFHTRRKDRPFREWLRRPASTRDRRNVLLDTICFCFLTPMVFTSAWLCIHGAFYYLSYYDDRGLESLGLIILATILIVIFLLWSIVSLRYHFIIWKAWRRENQTVHVVVDDRAPSLLRWDDSRNNNNCTVVLPTGKPDINGNFLWLHSPPRGDAFV